MKNSKTITELARLSEFDMTKYLQTDSDIEEYLAVVISENDPAAFLEALRTVAKAKGMPKLAEDTGIPRESLYRSLSQKGNPEFNTLWKIAESLGCRLVLAKKETVCA